MERDSRLTRSAVNMLESGHRSAAVALFDAVRQTDWDDAQLHNNYGFCLLPEAPGPALVALETAYEKGFTNAVNRANRAICLFRINRGAAALEVIEDAMDVWSELETDPSWLWAFDGDWSAPDLLYECPRCYLVRLGCYIAEVTDDETTIARWRRRRDNLQHEEA